MLPLASCPPESILGFFLRGAGVGASPCSHDGNGVEFIEAVSAGTAGFFFGAPSPIGIVFSFLFGQIFLLLSKAFLLVC
jgi:hypothetical protein